MPHCPADAEAPAAFAVRHAYRAGIGLAISLRYPLLALFLVMVTFALKPVFDHIGGRADLNLFEAFLAQVFIVYSTAAHTYPARHGPGRMRASWTPRVL